MRDWWRRAFGRNVTWLRLDGRAALLWSLRITVAATASYVAALLVFPGTQPLLAPLTAMLVVQVTPVSLLSSGLDRVISVVAGVSLAVGFAALVPLAWWSLGLLIFVAITLGQVLRLRANLVEVAISAMLVLGVGALGAESAAWQRITETLVGAAVGIAANLLFPPKVGSDDAGRAIDGLADAISQLLHRAAAELGPADAGRGAARTRDEWLDEARRITHDIPQVGAALLLAEQGRRLNVRAVGTPDVGPGLRQGLEALEHMAVAIRTMFRSVVDAVRDGVAGPELWPVLQQSFDEMADGIDAFGQLVKDEADPAVRLTKDEVEKVGAAREGLHEARARLEDLLLADSDPDRLELHAAVLSTVKRLLREMDLDERMRRQLRLQPVRARRAPAQLGAAQAAGHAAGHPVGGGRDRGAAPGARRRPLSGRASPVTRSVVGAVRGALGEEEVDRPACLGEGLRRSGLLVGGACTGDLADGSVELSHEVAEVRAGRLLVEARERVRALRLLGEGGASRVGDRGQLAARLAGDRDEALVLELVERRVDRAGARRPTATGAVGDRLHELVPVHRLLDEQHQHGGADVAARCAATTAAVGVVTPVVGVLRGRIRAAPGATRAFVGWSHDVPPRTVSMTVTIYR